MNIYLKLSIAILVGLVGARVAKKLKLPNVTGFLLGGLLLGPSFLNIIGIADKPVVNFVNELALSAIAFNIGGAFLYEDFKKLGKEIFLITIFEVVGVVAVVFLVMFFLLKQDFVFSIMVASMSAATAPAGTIMVIQQYRAKGPLTNTILPVAALDDALGIMVFGLALSVAKISTGAGADVSRMMLFLAPFIEIVFSLLLGLVLGIIYSRLISYVKLQDELLSLTLLFILGSTGISYLLKLSPLLTSMMIGAVYVNLSSTPKRSFKVLNDITPPINLLFFAFAGASLDLSILTKIGALGIAYVLARAAGKIIGATAGAKLADSDPVIQKYLGLALLPQGGISIGLSMTVARELPKYSESIVTLILFSVLIFEVAGPVLAKISLSKAGELRSNG